MFDKITSEDLTAESDAFWDAKELQIWELRQEAIMRDFYLEEYKIKAIK